MGFVFYFLNTKCTLLHSKHKLDTNSDPWPKNSKIEVLISTCGSF